MRPETKNNPDLKRISALTQQSLKTLHNLRPCVGSFKLLRIRGSLRKHRFAAIDTIYVHLTLVHLLYSFNIST